MKLDAKSIASLKLPDGKTDIICFDEDLSGFGIRLRATGGRVRQTWVCQYRAGGRSRRVLIGSVEKLGAVEARKAARKFLAAVELGGDPQGEKEASRRNATRTLRAVAEDYLQARKSALRPASFKVTSLYLTGPYFRPLHAAAIGEIGHPEVATQLRRIERAHSTSTAGAARRAISAMFAWAAAEGLMGRSPVNPVIGTRAPAVPTPRERVLTDDELAAIWRACQDDDFGRIVRLLILTGARRQEIGGMRWPEIDFSTGAWTLPRERSKNHRAHALVLPTPALEILHEVPQQVDRDYLFGVRCAAGFSGWDRGKLELDQRLADTVRPWRLHDLRRTFATGLADLGILPHTIEAALNHFSGHRAGVAGIYNRSAYEREVKSALALWADHVLALVEGRESTVIPLRGART